jgi:hypothetical protein
MCSYEMSTSAPDWADAEAQVQRQLKKSAEPNVTVSVKSSKSGGKRKGESAEEIYHAEIGKKVAKRPKKGES